jgi:trimethylamine--corrinoid protein Co-methyltransferase
MGGWVLPRSIGRVYDSKLAEQQLGFRCKTDFAAVLRALAEGGPGTHMFGTAHTMRHFETAYWDSAINDDRPWETWVEAGREDALQRANTRWREMLAAYEPPAIDPATDAALRDFIAERKDSMPDAWY